MKSKKKRIKPKPVPSKTKIHNKMLKEWKVLVRARDNDICQVCRQTFKSMHPHHVIPKSIRATAYDIDNGITLCSYHHTMGPYSAHKNALWFSNWLKYNKPEIYQKLMKILSEISP